MVEPTSEGIVNAPQRADTAPAAHLAGRYRRVGNLDAQAAFSLG